MKKSNKETRNPEKGTLMGRFTPTLMFQLASFAL